MRARNSFRGRRRAVSPSSARRGALAMGMMAATGNRSGFRNAVTGGGNVFDCDCCLDPYCQQKESGCKRLGGPCQCPCPASMSATSVQRSSFRGVSGGFRSQSGIGGLLDALADPVDISSGFFGGVDSLLDDLATPQNDLTFGGGTSVPPTPVYPVGHNGGVPPTPVYPAPTTPVPVMPSAALMPPPSRPRRRPAPRPRPMRPRRIQTGFSFM